MSGYGQQYVKERCAGCKSVNLIDTDEGIGGVVCRRCGMMDNVEPVPTVDELLSDLARVDLRNRLTPVQEDMIKLAREYERTDVNNLSDLLSSAKLEPKSYKRPGVSKKLSTSSTSKSPISRRKK